MFQKVIKIDFFICQMAISFLPFDPKQYIEGKLRKNHVAVLWIKWLDLRLSVCVCDLRKTGDSFWVVQTKSSTFQVCNMCEGH